VPEVSSPLWYDNRLYLVKNGGAVSCRDVQTGQPAHLSETLELKWREGVAPQDDSGRSDLYCNEVHKPAKK
jgi:hypothetical protein